MDEQLLRMEHKLDRLLIEVTNLKRRLDNYGHMPRDTPLGIRPAADYLQLSVSSMYKLIYAGELQPLQRTKGKRILFAKEELDNFLQKQQ